MTRHDGDLWFYEANSNKFGMLNPTSGAITEYPALFFSADPGIFQITAGSDGNIWFTEPDLNEVGMFDVIDRHHQSVHDASARHTTPGNHVWARRQSLVHGRRPEPARQYRTRSPTCSANYPYEPPGYTNNDQAEGITAGPNDTIWFVEKQNNQVEKFNITSQTFTDCRRRPYLPSPSPNSAFPTAQLWSIGEGPDGNIYYTEPAYNRSESLTQRRELRYLSRHVPPQLDTKPDVGPGRADATTGTTVFVTVPSMRC